MDTPARPHYHLAPHPHAGGSSGGGGREDCWSEGGTAALVESWGDRYLQLNRGNLRQKDWKDVADAVNARQDLVGKPRRTDIQCKNRIDTLKKKYKLEKSKPGPSQWPFFSRLDLLVGPNSAPSVKKPSAAGYPKPQPRHPSLTFTVKNRNPNPSANPAVYSGGSSSRSRMNSPGSSESSRGHSGGCGNNDGDDEDEEDNDVEEEEGNNGNGNRLFDGLGRGKRRWEGLVAGGGDGGSGGGGGSGSGDGAFGELARAIVKFAEIYERVESSKQQQMMELERQRMEFAKDLEFQRMQMFMEAQLELEKMKRPKYASGSAGKRL